MRIVIVIACLGLQLFNYEKDRSDEDVMLHSLITERQEIEISENFEVFHQVERNLTIFSKEGLGHAYTSIFYDRLNEIVDFELEMFDLKSGKRLKRAKLKDMTDVAIYSYSSVFDDNRRKYYEVNSTVFPVKVKITYKTKAQSNFNLPSWTPVHRYNQKVIKSSLKITYPKSFGLRYKELNLSGDMKQSENLGTVSLEWTEEDLAVQEADLKDEDDHKLLLAPVQFAMGDQHGEMNDWSGLAAWLYELNEGRDDLPDGLKSKIHQLVDEEDDLYAKVQLLYKYLQDNYRYVSIQLGIGGWQTMKTSEVVKNAYGDCKALTFLMQSMLAEVGIPSNYTLVFAGTDAKPILSDFPSNQFNHVILHVPTSSDPIWLECTSSFLPAGYLGEFTKDRQVLVTQKGGGYLTTTPAYSSVEWNKMESRNTIQISEDGNASIQTTIDLKGNFAQDMIYLKNNSDSRSQRDYFNSNSPISGLIINDFDLTLTETDSFPSAKVGYEGLIQKFVQNTAKRVILKSFIGKLSPSMIGNNTLDRIDLYEIELPELLELESGLETRTFEEEGVSVRITSELNDRNLRVKREIKIELDKDLSSEDRIELLKRANATANHTYLLLKPNE